MSRQVATVLTEKETERIIELLKKYKSTKIVADITHRSESKVYEIKRAAGLVAVTDDRAKREFLEKHWHFKTPKPEPKKRKSNFRTPYQYPGRTI